MKKGDRVRMTEAHKQALKRNGCSDHVNEFGSCVGIVQGNIAYSDGQVGPEWDVRWQPSNLRYAYPEVSLLIIT